MRALVRSFQIIAAVGLTTTALCVVFFAPPRSPYSIARRFIHDNHVQGIVDAAKRTKGINQLILRESNCFKDINDIAVVRIAELWFTHPPSDILRSDGDCWKSLFDRGESVDLALGNYWNLTANSNANAAGVFFLQLGNDFRSVKNVHNQLQELTLTVFALSFMATDESLAILSQLKSHVDHSFVARAIKIAEDA